MRLGLCYVQGMGVPKSQVEAESWWKRAADQGNTKAQLGLGLLYSRGEEIPFNPMQSYKWCRIAERGGERLPANFQTITRGLSPLQIRIADRFVDDFFKEREGTPPPANIDE